MMQLKILLCSTRPGRKGPAVAKWFLDIAKQFKKFKVELIDLKEEALPFLNEPELPKFQKYKHKRTWEWSKKIDVGDAYVFVTPEYNHGCPAPLKNALDFLFKEWNYKPVAFVSYGSIAGGSRSVQMLVQVVTALKMMPLTESVHIPDFLKLINKAGEFKPGKESKAAAETLLKELAKWSEGLKKMRQNL